jgi:hypothetical protein
MRRPSPEGAPTVRWLLLAILALGLALRLAHFRAISGTAYPSLPLVGTELDMYATLEWARTILAGDWLGRDTYHPYFQWMKGVAPLETWYRWWGGKEIFHQAPLYVYVVAWFLRLTNRSLEAILLIQLVLGALQPLVMYALGKQLVDARVGLAAAALTAGYGPFIFHQGTLLRDWIPPILEPLALWLILRAQGSGRAGTWLAAGALLGLALLTKESVLLFLPLVLLWILAVNRPPWPRACRAGGLLLLGLLLALSPLIWRNAVVGAPLLSISNRALEGFVHANVPQAYPVGFDFPASAPRILERAQGRIGRVVEETLSLYNGDWRRVLSQVALKGRGLVDPIEVPNDLDFAYALELSPPLRHTLRYGVIFPVGLAGMILLAGRWRMQLPILLYAAATLAALLTMTVIARYRLVLVPILILYAAAALVWLWDAARECRWGRLAGGVALVAAVAAGQHVLAPIPAVHAHPSVTIMGAEYVLSADLYAGEGTFDRAVAEIERLRARTVRAPDFARKADFLASTRLWEGQYRVQWANQLFDQGREEPAQGQVRLAQAAYLDYLRHTRAFELTFVPGSKLENPASAKEVFRMALDLNPQDSAAGDLRRLIARLGD